MDNSLSEHCLVPCASAHKLQVSPYEVHLVSAIAVPAHALSPAPCIANNRQCDMTKMSSVT